MSSGNTLTGADLKRRCGVPLEQCTEHQASDAALAMGGLARWWLRPEVLRLAAHDKHVPPEVRQQWQRQGTPELPSTPGSCWIILAQSARRRLPLLREAFVLPLVWRRGEAHSPFLPQGLISLADRVIDIVRRTFNNADGYKPLDGTWGLHPADVDNIAQQDLRRLAFEDWKSGFVSLAGGLILANNDVGPDVHIWATGACDGKTLCPVENVEAKVRLAAEWGATACYVPSDSARRVKAPPGLEICDLKCGAATLAAAMEDYLIALQIRPPATADREIRKNYYRRLKDPNRRDEYFRECLVDDVAEECRRDLLKNGEDWLSNVAGLVTIVSGAISVTLLSIVAVRPPRCLILHTSDREGDAKTIREACLHRKLPAENMVFKPFAQESMRDSMAAALEEFRRSVSGSGELVLDLTPGNKIMSLTLAMDLARCGDRLMYIDHREKNRIVEPFSQRIVSWRKT